MQAEFDRPSSLDRAIERVYGNALHFRANYSRVLAAWSVLCATRHPFSAIRLVVIGAASFHGLIVRRGVVHVSLPGTASATPLVTLMYPALHAALAIFSIVAIAYVGRVRFVLWLLLPPLAVAVAHAALRVPPRLAEVERLATELGTELRSALRDDAADGGDELEAGGDDHAQPEHGEALDQRVEAIRQKYRPPRKAHMD